MEIKAKEIKIVSIDSIIENPKNANNHPPEQIAILEKIIKHQGFRRPLTISNRSGFLIVGHGRLLAAKNLGLKEVPVIFQDYENEAQEFQDMIADNKIDKLAQHDDAKMIEGIKELGLEKVDFELMGLINFSLNPIFAENPEDEWDGMPEFDQQDKTSFRHIIVHFINNDDVEEFFKLIGQNCTEKTKSIWFPPQEQMETEAKRY